MLYTVVWTNVLDIVNTKTYTDYLSARMATEKSWVKKAWIILNGDIIYCNDNQLQHEQATAYTEQMNR